MAASRYRAPHGRSTSRPRRRRDPGPPRSGRLVGYHRYWEVTIAEDRPADAHYRVGWATRKAALQAPAGYDRWSFAYRDVAGAAVHASRRVDGYGAPFGPGDVVGCLLVFGDEREEDPLDLKPPDDSEMPPGGGGTPEGNYVKFFLNGADQGVAFCAVTKLRGAFKVRLCAA